MQFYYMVHPYKACLLSSDTKTVCPPLVQSLYKYFPTPQNSNFIELGCGKGNVSRFIKFSTKFKRVIGVEGDFFTFILAKVMTKLSAVKMELKRGNILKSEIPDDSAVYCYLFPSLIEKLYKMGKFNKSVLFSLSFPLDDIPPTEILEIKGVHKKLYIYDFRKKDK